MRQISSLAFVTSEEILEMCKAAITNINAVEEFVLLKNINKQFKADMAVYRAKSFWSRFFSFEPELPYLYDLERALWDDLIERCKMIKGSAEISNEVHLSIEDVHMLRDWSKK